MPQVREHSSVRRHQIANAARKIIIERGSENITIKALAGEVGISQGAIYRHFNQKQDVLLFLIDEIGENILNDLKNNGVGRDGDKVGTLLRRHISDVEQRRGVSFQIIAEIVSLGNEELNQRVSRILERYLHNIESLLDEGSRAGLIRADIDPATASILVFSLIHGLVNLWTLKNYDFNLKKKFNAMWDIACTGLMFDGNCSKLTTPAA